MDALIDYNTGIYLTTEDMMSRKIPRVTISAERRTPQGYIIKAVHMVTWAGVIVALQIRGYARIGRKPSPEEEADLQ